MLLQGKKFFKNLLKSILNTVDMFGCIFGNFSKEMARTYECGVPLEILCLSKGYSFESSNFYLHDYLPYKENYYDYEIKYHKVNDERYFEMRYKKKNKTTMRLLFSFLSNCTNYGFVKIKGPKKSKNFHKSLIICRCCIELKICSINLFLVDPNIAYFTKLRTLSLTNCGITVFSDEICDLLEIQEINLSKNKLKEVPNYIGKLQRLEHLDLSSNKLKTLPVSISGCKKLEFISIYNNLFKEIPQSILTCRSITNFLYGKNRFKSNQLELYNLPYLINKNKVNYKDKKDFYYEYKEYGGTDLTLEETCLRNVVVKNLEIPGVYLVESECKVKNISKCFFCQGPFFENFYEIIVKQKENGKKVFYTHKTCKRHFKSRKEKLLFMFSLQNTHLKKVLQENHYPTADRILNPFAYPPKFLNKNFRESLLQGLKIIYLTKNYTIYEIAEGWEVFTDLYMKYYCQHNSFNEHRFPSTLYSYIFYGFF